MRKLTRALISLSVVGFVLAVVGSFTRVAILGIAPEGFSRGCTNLALIAIALLLALDKERSAA
ncbi:MAG: hypothetical protein KAJ04_03330 [Candidatus Eisenbacteria sp.]|nr:hypothetical protein [Candidatus Eisenbacteria bacterium]